MTHPMVLKQTLPVTALTLAQAIAVPILPGLLLLFDRWILDVPFSGELLLLLSFVVVLGGVLLQPERGLMTQLIGGRRQLITRIAWRWLLLLFVLLAIAHVTKSSSEYSRRLILTWAVTTPAPLFGVALLIQRYLRQLLSNPASARRAVFVGYNDISVSLAGRAASNSYAGA